VKNAQLALAEDTQVKVASRPLVIGDASSMASLTSFLVLSFSVPGLNISSNTVLLPGSQSPW
jgi:hypothetical protein